VVSVQSWRCVHSSYQQTYDGKNQVQPTAYSLSGVACRQDLLIFGEPVSSLQRIEQPVLWIRNFMLRIRIRLFKEFRIRLLKSYGSGFGSDPNYLLFLQNYDFLGL
jgi:hypothetical protein